MCGFSLLRELGGHFPLLCPDWKESLGGLSPTLAPAWTVLRQGQGSERKKQTHHCFGGTWDSCLPSSSVSY